MMLLCFKVILDEEMKYKVLTRPLDLIITVTRSTVSRRNRILDENSRSSSFKVEETDIGEFSVLIEGVI